MQNKTQHSAKPGSIRRSWFQLSMVTLAVSALIFAATEARSQTYRVLYSFTGEADGANPGSTIFSYDMPATGGELTWAGDGDLYGTTSDGGKNIGQCCGGVIFKVDKYGQETTLYEFQGPPDGGDPTVGVIRDANDNIFGVTTWGGASSSGWYGTLFKLQRDWNEITLHSFEYPAGMGALQSVNPSYSGLLRNDDDGTLLGAMSLGGDGGCTGVNMSDEQVVTGCGAIYKHDRTTGQTTVLYSFTGGADGWYPSGDLARDANGTIYGTTWGGGLDDTGTIFKVDTSGKQTVLYSFTFGADGWGPIGIIRDAATGTLYGATGDGGTGTTHPYAAGTIYKLDTAGKFTVLYTFTGGTDGGYPYAQPLKIGDDLYGTTFSGGDMSACGGIGCGVVYKVDAAGKETVLHAFTGGADGANPYWGLTPDAKGNLYGAAGAGGLVPAICAGQPGIAPGCGVVFKITFP